MSPDVINLRQIADTQSSAQFKASRLAMTMLCAIGLSCLMAVGVALLLASLWTYLGSVEAFGRLPQSHKDQVRSQALYQLLIGVGVVGPSALLGVGLYVAVQRSVRSATIRRNVCLLVCFLNSYTLVASSAHGQETSSVPASQWETPYSAQLAAAGVEPSQTINVAQATIQLSAPYRYDGSRLVAVAWIFVNDRKSVHAIYRSNSQCCWRMVDAMDVRHIGKGFHEFDKCLPIDVTLAMLRASDEVGKLTAWNEKQRSQATQESLAFDLLKLLTVERDKGTKSGDVLNVGGGYVSMEYASWIPIRPRPFSMVTGTIKSATGNEYADPEKTRLPPEPLLPDVTKLQSTVDFHIPAYAEYLGTDGQMKAKVFPSRNGQLRYMFVEDSRKRAFLSCVENLEAPVCDLGLRTQYMDVQGMNAPLMEYGDQIPESYGGSKKPGYQLNWPYVQRLPIIRYYYSASGQPIPD